jgi:5-methylcytosine-specific restriction enzyme A
LDRLGRYLGLTKSNRFRNPNGVYMKLMNFRRFDPAFTEAGKVGLSSGGKLEGDIWDEFAADPERCHATAEAIQQSLEPIPEGEALGTLPTGDDDGEAEEGRVITAMHRRYERDPKIVQRKKQQALAP